jgi:ADP-ribose pyrophosphatase YjhB (NUDIX family)/adenosine deaminase
VARIAIDGGGTLVAVVARGGSATSFELEWPAGVQRAGLHEALLGALRVRVDGREIAFEAGVARVPAAARRASLVVGDGGAAVAEVELAASGARLVAANPISPFEARFLADNGRPHPAAPSASSAVVVRTSHLATDLHTHLAACVRPLDLVDIGARAGVALDGGLLARMGASACDTQISAMSAAARAALAAHLAIPPDRQTTFAGLEEVYANRAPITKSLAALPLLLAKIAEDYAAMGVGYVELSFANVVEARTLAVIHDALPTIEAKTGVTVRFLAAFHREDDLEWDLDLIDRLADLAGSKYVAGVDFMGHETNSTRAFAPQLRAIGAWATRARPGFVVRVHAGESPSHPENVRVALDETEGADVELRIGHGLYGVDERTLHRIASRGVVVEFNLGSNYALNNVQSAREVPLLRYLDRGAPVVLGTDGYGIYGTTPALEARTARLFGATEAHLERVRATEAEIVARRRAREATLPSAFDVPPDRPPRHFTPEVMRRGAFAREARDAALTARLDAARIVRRDLASLGELAAGRRVLAIAGAWRKSWDALGAAGRARVTAMVDELLGALDPGRVLLVTGGTRDGVEGVVQRAAAARGLDVVGALTAATPPEAIDDALTHAMIVADTLYEKAGRLYPALRELDAACVFVGGGAIVSDEIQIAENLRAHVLLMSNVVGASALHADEQPERAFADAAALLRALACSPRRAEPYRYVGANPTVDVVVLRGRDVLLVQRGADAAAEAGRWALPGGFVRSGAIGGGVWSPGLESIVDAALRELAEEAGVDLGASAGELIEVGVFERGGRDPRDTPSSWSRSHAFAVALDEADVHMVIGGGDACDARWFASDALPRLAFDHARIVAAALARLGR